MKINAYGYKFKEHYISLFPYIMIGVDKKAYFAFIGWLLWWVEIEKERNNKQQYVRKG